MTTMLSPVEAIYASVVLEDCVDQLAILGRIMPASYEGRSDAAAIVRDEISQIIASQKQLDDRFDTLLSNRGQKNFNLSSSTQNDIQSVIGNLKDSSVAFSKSSKQSPLTADNLSKIQRDRYFAENVINKTLTDIVEHNTFDHIIEAVTLQRQHKAELQKTILREEEGRKRIKKIHRQIHDVKREKESEIQNRNEMIAHLKDQLQEMKAKTNMEGKYVKKVAEVTVSQTQKKCTQSIKDIQEEIERLRRQIDEEVRVNADIENYLRSHQNELEQKVDHWMDRYDKDIETKQHELDVLKNTKANDLSKLQELTKTYAEYEEVVIADRIEKEKEKRRQEQEALELKATIKVQAWWRGNLVRHQLGPYSKKKKKGKKGKGKKSGKKSGGKKGKKKK